MRCRGFVSIWFPQLREKGEGPPQDSGVMRIKDNKQRDLLREKYLAVRKTMAQISAEWAKKRKKKKKKTFAHNFVLWQPFVEQIELSSRNS